MANCKLFIATTLDGYIARPNGSIDFLNEIPEVEGLDFGYGEFISGVDTLVMGRKTYDEVLGFGVDWPYPGLRTLVLSRNEVKPGSPDTEWLSSLNEEVIEGLKAESRKGIWVVGGGEVIKAFLNLHKIDEMTITIVPRVLGEGIPLFPPGSLETQFVLQRSESFENGLVNLEYRRKSSS